jgi:hypothetical protein
MMTIVNHLKVAPIVDLRSRHVGNSLLRATVREYNDTIVVQLMEITDKRTSKERSRKFAMEVARMQRGTISADYVLLSDVEVDRKGERLDGSKVLTHVRTMTFAFTTI